MSQSNRPFILVTNDDGIHAPGIKHLWQAISSFADVAVVAPSAEQSAVGLSITVRSPLHIEKITWPTNIPVWSVSGTPADCVKLGLNVILDRAPDLILSGINRGTNAGRNVLYSGTIGGVIEGIMRNIPGIAFSCYDSHDPAYSLAEQYVPLIVQHILQHPLPSGTFLNVNFPSKHFQEIKGIKLTRQGKEYWIENPDKREHPNQGHSYYWLGAKLAKFEEEADSDISLLQQGYLTAVPVHVGELTDHRHLTAHREHFERLTL
ncbi:5'/3'-nucleotidase SurE [Parachlamydia sp. AcF125]|uniref:5'/3'-nucleotidase SurE n=1 Tax=Parachlamydia sp. AcF125 TaxID=2795736 RepID=UPI001BC8C9E3|nr:5'/3'-nucleotidase SurE [Parachlamydia sp. AcF125]MBS4168821.1 5'-nucleotidase SurE [Parachlamydia sp. AcF125]